MLWSTVSKVFEDQQIFYEEMYVYQELSLFTHLDWEVHKKLNNVIKNQIVVNTLTCISQESHKSCYTPFFPTFYQELIVVILFYSFSILILDNFDPFLWIRITLANLSSEEKTLVEKEKLNILVICNDISFFNTFSIFAGRLLGPTDLLSFNNEIKLFYLN